MAIGISLGFPGRWPTNLGIKNKNETPRNMANICFSIEKVRETTNGEIII